MNNPQQLVDIYQFDAQDNDNLIAVYEQFNQGVSALRTLIESEPVVLHCGLSGKDSSVVVLMAVEAYRQSIQAGLVEPSRPLLVVTVDTGAEAIALKMYVHYVRKRLLEFGKQIGINLCYDIIQPPINDQYFIKYTGGQKLVPSVTRHQDCSIILKVDPSERYIKQAIKKYSECNYKLVSCVGSRIGESQHRAGNMKKQGLSMITADSILNDMAHVEAAGCKMYKLAPIKHWETEQVFDLLRIAGSNPIKRVPGIAIDSYLTNFGLLLELYGNGSNEVCDIIVGQKNNGCGGKARFGCVTCTLVGKTDNSATGLSKLPRWNALGSENALRVRDYLWRLSNDMDARALHARAYDPVTYNRVALQPNTLKPKYLEKMVRYAAQLTLDSIRIAKQFAELVANGKEMEHEGYSDIANDPNIPPKTKRLFLEMYREWAQDPKSLNYLFDEAQSLLLSFRWSIDGIGAAPFRPYAIYKQLESGQGWIPYPKLNSEMDDTFTRVNQTLPEAVMMPILKAEIAKDFAKNPVNLLDLWTRPHDMSDLYDEDRNCTISRFAQHNGDAVVDYTLDFEFLPEGHNTTLSNVKECWLWTKTGLNQYRFAYGSEGVSVKVNGRTINDVAKALLLPSIQLQIDSRVSDVLNALCEQYGPEDHHTDCENLFKAFTDSLFRALGGNQRQSMNIPYLQNISLLTGYTAEARKANLQNQFSRRVVKISKQGIEKGNSRMVFYKPRLDCKLHEAHKQTSSLLVPNFSGFTQQAIATHEDVAFDPAATVENIKLSELSLAKWYAIDGPSRALKLHHDFMTSFWRNRHSYGYKPIDVRRYGGTHVAETLLAEGVITIKTSYWSQLQAILKRTQIFQQLGMFSFQSMPYIDVANHPSAIDMAHHRRDKAEILKIIRTERNAQRSEVKTAINNDDTVERLGLNVEPVIQEAGWAVRELIDGLNSHLLQVRFDTSDVGVSQRAGVSKLWLALMFGGVTQIDDLLKHLLTPAQLVRLKEHPSDYLKAGRIMAKALNLIGAEFSRAAHDWNGVISTLKQQLCKGLTREEYKATVGSLVPAYVFDHSILEWWKPSPEHFKLLLGKALETMQENLIFIESLNQSLQRVQRLSMQQAANRMTLGARLTALKRKAA